MKVIPEMCCVHLILCLCFYFYLQVAGCYSEETVDFPQQLWDVLKMHSTVLDRNMRMVNFIVSSLSC